MNIPARPAWNMIAVIAVVLFMSAISAPRLHAEATDDQATDAERIRVEGTPEPVPTDRSAFTTTIRAEEFASRIVSLPELLAETVGLKVTSYGGLGSFATVSIRGSTAEQVNIYLDGVLLNPSLGGGVNLADLPIASIEEIRIHRGVTPAHLDAAGIGGAIEILTRRARPGEPSASGSLSYGSHGRGEAIARAAWGGSVAGRDADGLISFGGNTSRGDFRFFDNNGTPFDAGDDGYSTRRNNTFWTGDLLGRAGLDLEAGGRLEAQAGIMRRRQGVPGIDAFQSETARAGSTRLLARIGFIRDQIRSGAVRLESDLHYSRTSQEFSDRAGDTTGSGAAVDAETVFDSIGPSARLFWNPVAPGWRRHHMTLLASARFETSDRTDRLNPRPERGEAGRTTGNLGVQDEIHLAGGRVALSPSLRWSRFASRFDPQDAGGGIDRRTDTRTSARMGVSWLATRTLSVRGNAGRFYRLPTFTELFGDQGTIGGNVDLAPEQGWNYDLGVVWEAASRGPGSRLHLEVGAFLNDADNLIQFVQTSQNRVTAQNTGRARVTGLELSASAGLLGWLDASLDYTWQIAIDRSGTFTHGTDLPGRPRHELSARAAAARPWGRPFYEFSYTGPTFFDPAAATLSGSARLDRDQLRVPGRYLHNAGFTRTLGRRLDLTVEVDNIANVRTVDVVRYPLPGRMAQARLRVRLP